MRAALHKSHLDSRLVESSSLILWPNGAQFERGCSIGRRMGPPLRRFSACPNLEGPLDCHLAPPNRDKWQWLQKTPWVILIVKVITFT